MKRLNTVMAALLLIQGAVFAQENKGIRSENNLNWEQIRAKAKAQHKPIFVYLYIANPGTLNYRGAEMQKSIFPLKEVADFYNANFINVSFQLDTTDNDSQEIKSKYAIAKELASTYHIVLPKKDRWQFVPQYLFFNADGEISHKAEGVMDDEDLIKLGQNTLKDELQIFSALRDYQAGKRGPARVFYIVTNYLKAIGYIDEAQGMAADYIARLDTLTTEQKFSRENLDFIADYSQSVQSPGFKFLFSNAQKIEALPEGRGGKAMAVARFLIVKEEIYNTRILEKDKKGNAPDIKSVEKRIVGKYGSLGERAIWPEFARYYFGETLRAADKKQDADYRLKYVPQFVSWKDKLFTKYPQDADSFTYGNDAWFVFQNVDDKDKKSLETAMKWAKDIVDKEPGNGANIDTYANILYRFGNHKDALEWEAKAVKADPARKEIADNFEKMKRGEKTW